MHSGFLPSPFTSLKLVFSSFLLECGIYRLEASANSDIRVHIPSNTMGRKMFTMDGGIIGDFNVFFILLSNF